MFLNEEVEEVDTIIETGIGMVLELQVMPSDEVEEVVIVQEEIEMEQHEKME